MTCTHHWKLSSKVKRDGDKRITTSRCRKCGGERDYIIDWGKIDTYGQPAQECTDIVYPERTIELKNVTKKNEARKDEIIAVFKKYKGQRGAVRMASEELSMAESTLRYRLSKWGEIEHRPVPAEPPSSATPDTSVDNYIPPNNKPVNAIERNRYYESIAMYIIADVEAGMTGLAIKEKYGISKNAFTNFKRRHGLIPLKSSRNGQLIGVSKLIEVIDTRFKKKERAGDFIGFGSWWEGLKTGIGFRKERGV